MAESEQRIGGGNLTFFLLDVALQSGGKKREGIRREKEEARIAIIVLIVRDDVAVSGRWNFEAEIQISSISIKTSKCRVLRLVKCDMWPFAGKDKR